MSTAPKTSHDVDGMGRVYDWRGTGLLPPNGGRISLQAIVHHIPVVPNLKGTEDFQLLARVLKNQGLSLQFATDREGNVAIYNNADSLCFQARGLNSLSCGIEHMHMTISEPWTERQYRAAAWIAWWVKRHHGIPYRNADLRSNGPGVARVAKTGHTTHAIEARVAGFNDRSDPGPNFRRPHVFELAEFYEKRRTFKNAPTI